MRIPPDGIWADYLKHLNACCDAVKLTAYHTGRTAEATMVTAKNALLTTYCVNKYLHKIVLPEQDRRLDLDLVRSGKGKEKIKWVS